MKNLTFVSLLIMSTNALALDSAQLINKAAVGALGGILLIPIILIVQHLKKSSKLDENWNRDLTNLMKTAASGSVHEANTILQSGANINEVNKNGYTALMYAARNNNIEMLEFLLTKGADKNLKTKRGRIALDFANISKSKEAITILS